MKYILKILGYLVILFAPIDAFKILGGYFSLYRITVILCFFMIVIDVIKNKGIIKVYNKYAVRNIVVFGVFNIFCICISDKSPLGISYFLNDSLGLLVILEFTYIFNNDNKDTLLLTYVKSQFITLGFSVYAICLHFFMGMKLSTSWDFLFLRFQMSDNSITLLSQSKSFLPMLFMPYATTLHLDMSVGIAAIICLYFYVKVRKISYLILGVIFSFLVLLSAQKGPIIAFTVSVIIFMRFYRKKQGIKRTISFLMIVFIIVSPIAIGFANEIIQYTILRFREFGHRISVNEDRHVLLVYEAIYVWLSEIKNFFIGVGYSGHAMLDGKYTYVPENFLSSLATLVAERGLLSIFAIYFYVNPLMFFRKYRNEIYNILIFVLLNFLFYELRYIQTSWIIYAIIYCCMNTERKINEKRGKIWTT